MASDNKTVHTGGGIGFGGLLALLFIGLKLGGVIDWSWWWVLSPLWIPIVLILAIVVLVIVWTISASKKPTYRYDTRRIR